MSGPGLTGNDHRLVVRKDQVERTPAQIAAAKEFARMQQEDRHTAQKNQAQQREAERLLVRESIEQAKKNALGYDRVLARTLTEFAEGRGSRGAVADALSVCDAAWGAVSNIFRKAKRDRKIRRRAHEILGFAPSTEGE